MAVSLISLGANLGDRLDTLRRAVECLRASPGVTHAAVSRWRETAPVGGPDGQPPFLNGAARLETALSPHELLAVLRSIERQAGRERSVRWQARTLDLDLLLYDGLTLDSPALTLPHPRMAFRRFVLEPAAEVAGDLLHPVIQWTVAELLAHLNSAADYVAVTGVLAVAKRALAERIVARCGGRQLARPSVAGTSQSEPLPGGNSNCDSTGPGIAAAIESLDFGRQRLSPATIAGGGPVVSDFWFDEWLAAATATLRPGELAIYEQRWREARADVVAPKLIVALGMTSNCAAGGSSTDRFRQALAERLRQPRQGPLLHVPADDLEFAAEEAAAAVLAMR